MASVLLEHNLDAERAVLGAILLDPKALDAVGDRLTESAFYRDSHRAIWAAVVRLSQRSVAADLLTVKAELGPKLDECGGAAYLASLIDGVPLATNVRFYADLLKEAATKRAVVLLAHGLLEAAGSGLAASELVDEAERRLLALSADATPGEPRSAAELGIAIVPVLDRLHGDGRIRGVRTGLPTLDALTQGLKPGQLWVLGGRPSEGKSLLAQQIARDVARLHEPVLLVSLEMSDEEQVIRAIAAEAPVDGHRLESGRLTPAEQERAADGIETFKRMSLWIDDGADATVLSIRSKARRLKAQHGLSLLVLDYLQLLRPTSKSSNRQEQVAEMSRALKLLAKELRIPVLALSQLSRATEANGTKRKPRMSDLRESGAIEQDADVVLLIHRPEPDAASPTPPTELVLAKQRNGPTGELHLHCKAEQYRLVELDPYGGRA